MSIDLKNIARENVRKYGTDIDRYGPVLLAHLYSDRTHFVFELLQNAEDAGASQVDFYLHPDRLEMRHNGRPFNEKDVRGICGLVEGTKTEDYTKIGRFGIGFKSVYAYTCSPEIHSVSHHFRIKNYVIPEAIDRVVAAEDLTIFIFPFDHPEASASDSHDEIQERLEALGLRTLLFLKHIDVIRWFAADEFQGKYQRKTRDRKFASTITLESETDEGKSKERWLVFRRAVFAPDTNIAPGEKVHIEIAYSVTEEKPGSDQITRITESPLAVFFETEKETELGFLVQGPYVTTPARDNVPEKHEWNVMLVSETATLVVESLRRLKEMGLLSVHALTCMPLDEIDFQSESMFRPIFDAVRGAIATEELLPVRAGGFTSGKNAILARGADMVSLFNPRRLKELLSLPTPPKWLSTDITQNKTPALYGYLTDGENNDLSNSDDSFQVLEVRPETIVHNLSREFMKKQNESWTTQLYIYFSSKQDLHHLLRESPILRTQKGTYVAAVDQNGVPAVFLPSKGSSGYPTIKRSLTKKPTLLEFFRSLGLTEPNLTSEVLREVLPKYHEASPKKVGIKEHREDIEKIVSSLRSNSELEFELEEALQSTAFLRGKNAKTRRSAFKKPGDLYRPSPDLLRYFESNASTWFLSEATEFEELFVDLGVNQTIEVNCRKPGRDGYVIVASENRNHQRGIDGFDPDCEIDGLAHALEAPTIEKSRFIWNELLIPNAGSIKGKTQEAMWHTYKHATERETFSPMGELVTEACWLSNGRGKFVKAEDLCADDLPDVFVRNEELIKCLGMRPANMSVLAEEAGIPVDLLNEIRKAPNLFAEFLSWKNESEDEDGDDKWKEEEEPLERSEKYQPQENLSESSDPLMGSRPVSNEEVSDAAIKSDVESNITDSPKSYSTLLSESFNRPQVARFQDEEDESEYYSGDGTVKNPKRRMEKLTKRHRQSLANEPPSDTRRTTIERTLLEASNPDTRSKLYQWYQGRCQICGRTWPERNGDSFFVSAYLVERKHARAFDDPANAICLCAEHFAQWKLAAREALDVIEQIQDLRLQSEGGNGNPCVRFKMFDETFEITYCEQHLLSLKQLLEVSGE